VLGVSAVAFPGAGKITDGVSALHLDVSEPRDPNDDQIKAKADNAVFDPRSALSTEGLPSEAPTQTPEAAPPSDAPHDPAASLFEVGDKLKIVVYERIESGQEDKWGRNGDSGFVQRPEFSGEPTVESDGTITLALLGQFPVADRSAQALEQALAASFQQLTRHPGLVTIVSVERPPVYVLGPVKTPGTYKFMPGMTVLHAVALAGGFTVQAAEPWQQLEAAKAAGNRRTSLQLLPKLLARIAVLKGERDGAIPQVSPDLLQLAGADVGQALIAREVQQRSGIAAARAAQRDALSASLAMAQQEIQRISKLQQPLDALIALRRERAEAMKSLAEKGQIGRAMVIQAQGDLMDAQQRRQDVASQLSLTAQRVLTTAQQEIARFEADTRASLESQISFLDQQIGTADGDAATSLDILSTLQPRYAQGATTKQVHYVVVRRSANGPVEIAATGLTSLRPGDLVKLDLATSNSGDENSPGAAAGQPASSPILVQDGPQ
jgi:protein involved in polysaccharide export with SLBB domain